MHREVIFAHAGRCFCDSATVSCRSKLGQSRGRLGEHIEKGSGLLSFCLLSDFKVLSDSLMLRITSAYVFRSPCEVCWTRKDAVKLEENYLVGGRKALTC